MFLTNGSCEDLKKISHIGFNTLRKTSFTSANLFWIENTKKYQMRYFLYS